MSLLPRYLHTSDREYGPFSRFLDDIFHYGRAVEGAHGRSHKNIPTFQPKFDVIELDDAYKLHGELPGLQKKDIHVEFIEPRTLLISGKIERSSSYGSLPEGWLGVTQSPVTEQGEFSGQSEKEGKSKEEAQNDGKNIAVEGSKGTETATYPKTWVSERSVGEFSRTFSFPHHIQQDETEASLDNGVLYVKIPKTEKVQGHIVGVQ
jgi:HSP20 family molecular chaperone IbpA